MVCVQLLHIGNMSKCVYVLGVVVCHTVSLCVPGLHISNIQHDQSKHFWRRVQNCTYFLHTISPLYFVVVSSFTHSQIKSFKMRGSVWCVVCGVWCVVSGV